LDRRLSPEDAGNYMVNVRNKFGEKANHVRLSMKARQLSNIRERVNSHFRQIDAVNQSTTLTVTVGCSLQGPHRDVVYLG